MCFLTQIREFPNMTQRLNTWKIFLELFDPVPHDGMYREGLHSKPVLNPLPILSGMSQLPFCTPAGIYLSGSFPLSRSLLLFNLDITLDPGAHGARQYMKTQ